MQTIDYLDAPMIPTLIWEALGAKTLIFPTIAAIYQGAIATTNRQNNMTDRNEWSGIRSWRRI
ncbi:MAG TPA: hypothetical protein IGS53_14255 [Leptolyngbyaceae cyanobacterium M33_DOE_097]|nr:hypothetical protein [Leptolyngbyaceae cyanobacterium M33_DOE_097]